MPTMPGARFAMIEPRLALRRLKAFLDRPAQTSDSSKFIEFGRMRRERHVERHIGRIGNRTADQQPMIPGRRLQTKQTESRPVVKPRAFRSFSRRQAPPFIGGETGGEILRRVRVKIAHNQSLIAANGKDIRLVVALQHDAQRLVAAVNRVAQHPSARNASVQRRRHHCDADLGLRGELHITWNSGQLPPLGVLNPVLWQIEAAVDQGVTFRARVTEENADLTVLDPPGGPAVLTRNPDRMAALLQEPGLVQNQDARWIAETLDHIIAADVPRFLLIPSRSAEQSLHPPGSRIAGVFSQLPAILAFGPTNQPFKKETNLSSRFSATKQTSQAIFQRRKLFKPRQRRARPIRNRHPTLRRDSSGKDTKAAQYLQL